MKVYHGAFRSGMDLARSIAGQDGWAAKIQINGAVVEDRIGYSLESAEGDAPPKELDFQVSAAGPIHGQHTATLVDFDRENRTALYACHID